MLISCKSNNKSQQKENTTNDNSFYMLVGTYCEPSAEGIHVFRFDQETGEVSERISGLAGISNPSYLHPSADGEWVYAVAEDNDEEAAANALKFDKEKGILRFLNEQKTQGAAPCYINSDREGSFVVTANYTGGNISVFPLNESGGLEPVSQVIPFSGKGDEEQQQRRPHLHCAVFSPDQQYLYAADLGTDQVHFFQVTSGSSTKEFLTPGNPASFSLETGSGPRHLTFHPHKPYAYLINELSGKVTAFRYNAGLLEPFQYIASDTVGARGSADIHITPDGKFLYSSNRLQADGLAIFSIDPESGELTRIGYQDTGIHPRNFIITPNGNYLLVACRDSNVIQIFRIDKQTGLLTSTGDDLHLEKPVCIKFI